MTSIAIVVRGGEQVQEFIANTEISGWGVLLAGLSLIAGWLLSKVTRRLVHRLLGRIEGIPVDAKLLLARVAGYFVIALGLAFALSLLGADVAPLLTVLLVVVVVLALALRSVAENFAAGIVLQTRRTVALGDEIAALGHTGVVETLNSRSVVIRTADGRQVHLPNVKLLEGPVANHTVLGGRRSELAVQLTGRVDIDTVVERVLAAMEGVGEVRADPAPSVATMAIGVDRLDLAINFWHNPSEGSTAISAVAAEVAAALRVLELDFILGRPAPTLRVPAPFPPPTGL